MRWVRSKGIVSQSPPQAIEVESDAKKVIQLIDKDNVDLTEVKNSIDEIDAMASRMNISGFNLCYRSCNEVANGIAHTAAGLGLDFFMNFDSFPNSEDVGGFWVLSYPLWLISFVNADMLAVEDPVL